MRVSLIVLSRVGQFTLLVSVFTSRKKPTTPDARCKRFGIFICDLLYLKKAFSGQFSTAPVYRLPTSKSRRGLNIQVLNAFGVCLNKLLARQNFISHQDVKNGLCLFGLLNGNTQEYFFENPKGADGIFDVLMGD